MPRQPHLPHFAHLNYAVGALVFENRPKFCAAIAKCIALWGQVDNVEPYGSQQLRSSSRSSYPEATEILPKSPLDLLCCKSVCCQESSPVLPHLKPRSP